MDTLRLCAPDPLAHKNIKHKSPISAMYQTSLELSVFSKIPAFFPPEKKEKILNKNLFPERIFRDNNATNE